MQEVALVIMDRHGSTRPARVVQASNAQRLQLGKPVSEIVCSENSQLQWCISVDSHVIGMAGARLASLVTLLAARAALACSVYALKPAAYVLEICCC